MKKKILKTVILFALFLSGNSIANAWTYWDLETTGPGGIGEAGYYISNFEEVCNTEYFPWSYKLYFGEPFDTSTMTWDVTISEFNDPEDCTDLNFGSVTLVNGTNSDSQGEGSGNYWVAIESPFGDFYNTFSYYENTPEDYYYDVNFEGTNTNSRIDTISFSTSTQKVLVTGYWEATTTPGIHQELEFWQESSTLGRESYDKISATTTGEFAIEFEYKALPTPYSGTTTAPFMGTTVFKSRLLEINGAYYDPFGQNGLDQSKYKRVIDEAQISLTEETHNFDDPRELLEYPEFECSITAITGCLKNAGIWLFYPSQSNVDRFQTLSEDIKGKF